MAAGIGFSVGDIFTTFKLIKDSIDAIKDTKGASADYAALLTEIDCLQEGLKAIKDLQLNHNGSHKQQTAIARAAQASQTCIDDFRSSISKYQRHLHSNASGWMSNYWKIKWALCRKDDVAAFRAQLQRYVSSIKLLLIAFRANESVGPMDGDKSTVSNVRLQDENRDGYSSTLAENMSIEQRTYFELPMHQNQESMRNVQDYGRMLRIQKDIPPQVLSQQPVIPHDVLGKAAPFHLDIIDSYVIHGLYLCQLHSTDCGLYCQNIQANGEPFDFNDQSVIDQISPIDRSNSQYMIQHPGMKANCDLVCSSCCGRGFFCHRRARVISQHLKFHPWFNW